jgi:hypothetical protein
MTIKVGPGSGEIKGRPAMMLDGGLPSAVYFFG